MKTKILSLFSLLILVVSILCSCFSDGHTHQFTDEFHKDDINHWHQCDCGEKSDVAEHTFDEGEVKIAPTEESKGEMLYTCTVCSYQKTEPIDELNPDHTHSYDLWYKSEYTHGTMCVCGEVDKESGHTWDNGAVTTPATEIQTGIKTFTCTECGHKSTEYIPSTGDNGMSFRRDTHYRMADKLAETPRTFEAEIKVPAGYTGRPGAIFANSFETRQDWLFEIFDGGIPRFYYGDSEGHMQDYRFTKVRVNTGEWIHIALTFDFENKTLSLYIDGELAETQTLYTDFIFDTTRYKFILGGDNRSNNGLFFQGEIRSIAAYSDVRTADEIARSAEKGTNLYADDLLVAYLVNENSGEKDIYDLTENGYDIDQEWLDSHEPGIDYAYSFAVIGDTQWLSKYKPEKMKGIYDWILENKDERKIAHVFGLGDITEDWNDSDKEQEWIQAQQFIYQLNGIVPYSLVRGNHDESKYFNKYFATEEYMNQYNGEFMVEGDIRNSYKTLTFGEVKYLILNLDFGPGDAILEWAGDVVSSHPDHRVIITTHAYQGSDGGHFSADNVQTGADIYSLTDVDITYNYESRDYNNGKEMWENFVSKHPNIFLVLSGHTADEDILLLQSEGEHGNVVNQMLIDPQWMDPQKDGVGMVAMLYFSEDGNQLAVEWISSDTGKYYKECNQFTLDLTDCFGAPDHTFSDSYDETHHYKACDCGYACDKEAHAFDNGETDANGDTKYTCDCGYVKVIPKKATATYVTLDGEVLDVVEVDANADGLYYITAPTLDGYVAEYDRLILNPKHDSLNVTVYCSTVAVWDGVSVSSGLKGKGTEDDPFLIESGADLKYLADKVNAAPVLAKNFAAKHFKFTQSIDLNGHDIYIGHYPTGGEGWKYRKSLYSYIDGNHCTIRGLDQAGSVFGGIETGYLKNLSVYGSISAPTYEFVGGVVGYICNGTVLENLTSYVTINGKSGLGGIVGNSENMATDVVNCVNYGNVTGTAWNNGGIVGIAGHNVTNCVNYGNVIGGDNNIGGIAGETKLTGIISGCINYGSVTVTNTSKGKTGGVVGNAQKPVVGCINYGTVTGASIAEGGTLVDTTTGGICGTSTIKISNSINYGTINGTNTTGGIAGLSAGKIENCTNHGKVNATSWNIGGIAGRASGNGITGCYNYGDVTTTSDAIGGIVGTAQSDIVNCENNGTVKGRANVGGIVGVGHKLISNCVNNGDVNANWDCGGILGKVTSSVVSVVDCINNGSVTATPNSKGEGGTGVGGIFGYISGGYLKITDCTNNGAVAGTWGVGGIAGNISIDTTISGCVNTGTLNAMGELGGIVGKCSGKVTGCTNKGIVSGTNSIIGGIVGNLHDTTYLNDITTTNKQEGTVSGNGSQEIIGKQ